MERRPCRAAGLALAAAGLAAPALAAFAGRGPSRATTLVTTEFNASLVDDLEGLAPLLATGADRRHFDALERRMDDMLEAEGRLASVVTLGQFFVGAAGELAAIAVLAVGAPLVRSGTLSGDNLTGGALAALASLEAFGGIPGAFAGIFGVLASADRLFALLDRKPHVIDPKQPAQPPERFDLVLNGVGLVYPGARRWTASSSPSGKARASQSSARAAPENRVLSTS